MTRPCDLLPDESWWCETAPGTASGFKGVSPYGKKWRARAWVTGKGMRTVWVAASAAEAAWMLARWHQYPCELPSPPSKLAKASNGMSRVSDSEERAPLSPRRLSGGNQRVDEWHASESAKRRRSARTASPRYGVVFRWTGRPGLATYRIRTRVYTGSADPFLSSVKSARPELTAIPRKQPQNGLNAAAQP